MRKKVLLILGMHRSGTSATTRICNLLGVRLGKGLVPALPNDNETGFWELQRIVDINESILEHFQLDHLNPGALPPYWEKDKTLLPFQRSLQQVIEKEALQPGLWGMKDPRTCRLLPLWIKTFKKLRLKPVFLFAIRNPLEVAYSLHRRNGLPLETGLELWLRYNIEAEYYSRKYKRYFLYFNDIYTQWDTELAKAAKALRITWPRQIEDVKKDVAAFLSPSLRHNHVSNLQTPGATLPASVEICFQTLHRATITQRCNKAALNRIRKSLSPNTQSQFETPQSNLLSVKAWYNRMLHGARYVLSIKDLLLKRA